MSKGLGRVERLILDKLSYGCVTVGHTVSGLREFFPTVAESSLRRALASLERKGLVEHRSSTHHNDFWRSVAAVTEVQKREARREKRREKRLDELFDRAIDQRAEQLAAQRRREAEPAAGQLAKLLGMMGSDHDGEVLSAALKVEDARKKSGKTWQELLGLE
jgi:DNA-binding PadR family transcriptional regulator